MSLYPHTILWRGSLLPLGCEAAPNNPMPCSQTDRAGRFTTASPPSGSKLPRHKSCARLYCIGQAGTGGGQDSKWAAPSLESKTPALRLAFFHRRLTC
nr:hypothetical protein C1892_11645 [Pseudomonas sp. MPBD7-1]